ncbi:hypothetical protein PR048_019760 [Dryococelus australis]|uniref:Uncharacterized protein n=1 Tax=Dryococelus australis TaxID=614101 RepID=A0ABQ9H4C4_9NEOP|nr:hypothetical protein PR048_019760 [Dryococelus australis]
MTDSDDRLEDRSVDSIDSFRGKSQDGLDAESLLSDGPHRAYPPDLLTFPPRAGGGHASPAGSSASTAPDSTRLPPQSPAQLLPPPHLLFGTLPYSRSQSPFSASQPRLHQGYVTIPRRPRVPSWGSAHDGLRLEPVYDNLGPRTTADGSSVLSLNKTPESAAATPMRGRPLPPPPIKEQPSPAPVHRLGAASPGPWSRGSPEGASLARRPLDHSTPVSGQRTTLKIPPRPPPKPRKVVDVPSGPLFEDEGEDGTEV